jgi:hypothetical protein
MKWSNTKLSTQDAEKGLKLAAFAHLPNVLTNLAPLDLPQIYTDD